MKAREGGVRVKERVRIKRERERERERAGARVVPLTFPSNGSLAGPLSERVLRVR
jgi:hypothetical protein